MVWHIHPHDRAAFLHDTPARLTLHRWVAIGSSERQVLSLMSESQPRRGRKPVHMDLEDLEKLGILQCTDEEIAGWFGVSTRTIEKRRKKPEFAAAIERGRARGRISVRRAQIRMLDGGNATMGVWLGKQILGQRDVITAEHVGSGGGPIQVAVKPDPRRLNDDELRQLRELAVKTQPDPGNR